MKINQLMRSKTLWLGFATVCTGLGMYFSGEQTLQELMVIIIGVAFSILRFFTNESLGSK